MLRHPAGVGQGAPEQQLDVGVETAELVRRPPRERVVHRRIDTEEYLLSVSTHE